MSDDALQIDDSLSIPLKEIAFRYARSSGPGGQHVQRTETKVELLFDVANSPSLTDEQRRLILQRLANRVDGDGVLHLTSQMGRSQFDNRQEAIRRFGELLAGALKPEKPRKPTKPSAAARQRRLEAKRRRAEIKRQRRRVASQD